MEPRRKKVDINIISKNCKKLETLVINNMGILKIIISEFG